MTEHDTLSIVCPYCGYVYKDCLEIDSGEENMDDITCAHCEELFACTRNILITYTTEEILS